jgi:hypothetical protein
MLKEPALCLHAPGLKISSPLLFSCQHQSPRNSSGIEPRIAWAGAGCHCAATNSAAAINFFIRFFLFLDRAASFHFGAVERPSCGILTAFAGHVASGISFGTSLFDKICVVNLRGRFEIGYQACSPSSKALACFRSSVSRPSVKQP